MPGSFDSRFCVCRVEKRGPPEEALERRRSLTEGRVGVSLLLAPLLLLLLLLLVLPVEEVVVLEPCWSRVSLVTKLSSTYQIHGVRDKTFTYTSSVGHHFGSQGPRGACGGTLGAALYPDVVVLVAVAGFSVPVAAGIVGHIGEFWIVIG